jgi:hypothetical protein
MNKLINMFGFVFWIPCVLGMVDGLAYGISGHTLFIQWSADKIMVAYTLFSIGMLLVLCKIR